MFNRDYPGITSLRSGRVISKPSILLELQWTQTKTRRGVTLPVKMAYLATIPGPTFD
jgi:hypothetical protein